MGGNKTTPEAVEPLPAPARDFDAELRLGCLKAALELRTPGSPPQEVLALADLFYAWAKGPKTNS